MAFIAYLPATVLLGRAHGLIVPFWAAAASPLAGPVLLGLALVFFSRMTRCYSSPGS
jgi:ABC-2 type transport system permease protein